MIKWLTNIRSLAFMLCLLMAVQQNVWGQYTASLLEKQSLREVKNTAKNALRLGDSYTALAYYEEWSNRVPENTNVLEKTADLYRITRNYKKAEEWYLKLLSAGVQEKYPLSLFFLGEVQMAQEKYTEAKVNFSKFKKLSKTVKDPSYRKLTKYRLLSCDYAAGLKDSSEFALTQNLGTSVNLPHIEFSPVSVEANQMIYGSLKEKSVNLYDAERPDSIKLPRRQLYVAEKEFGKWVSKGPMEGPINAEGKDIGNAVLSEDGQRMYLTYCEKNWQNRVICHLYLSEKEGGKWTEPVKMNEEINLPNFTSTQPAIGRASKSNQEVLYFVSDRPGGKGGLDVWYTEYHLRRKSFKTPRNAGSKINSVGTECTPYYDLSAHRLYFSSDGNVGLGGLDVYSADGEKSKWQEPVHLKTSINSAADDLDFTLHKNKEGGFLVSNRKGGAALLSATCCDDIYEFTYTQFVDIRVSGKVEDGTDCLKNYRLKVYIEDEETEERYLARSYTIDTCGFEVTLEEGKKYRLEVEKDGYLTSFTHVNTEQVKSSTLISKTVAMNKVPSKPIALDNIFFEFNSPNLTPEAKAAIDSTLYQVLVSNPTIKIRIGAHTDSRGTEAYNLSLSKKRAQSVVKYLMAKGIQENRLESEGYGESRPIAPNTKEDGSDNPEGRKLNRRTELEVIGTVELEPLEED